MPVLKPLSGDGDAPQQHKQPSRKGKKAWRKNVDVTEVQDGLDELNKQIITGGVVAEKDSADLFTLDTVGKIEKRPKPKKTLKSDEIIAARSSVPAVSSRKKRENESSKTANGLLPVKRQRTDWVSHKELDRLRRVADGQEESSIVPREATYDLWGATAPAAVAAAKADPSTTKEDNFLPPLVKAKPPKTLKHKPLSLAASGKQIPAVLKPTGGYSYNPTFDDYADRLEEESAKAVAAEQARLAAEEAERIKREAVARSAAEAEAAEARAQLSEWDEDSAWEGFESGVEDDKPSLKRPQRKTPQQRNRIKRRKEAEREAKHQLAMKKKAAQAEQIKQIAAEIAERDASKNALALAKEVGEGSDADDNEDVVDEGRLRRRQLGKMKLPEKDLELVLPDELQDSLRLLRPEGNLLKDRYRSLLVRGRVEARRHIPFKKQARTKLTEKWSYKDFKI
ncbi:60s ribosomal biogenesis protein [Colletotrichum incanum]|nr:60s ribosomal biogenesis protein [Colletotrichum incanum]